MTASAVGELFSDFDFSSFFRKLLNCFNGDIDDFRSPDELSELILLRELK